MVLYLSMKSIGNWKRSTVLSKSERNNLPDYEERPYFVSDSALEKQLRSIFLVPLLAGAGQFILRGYTLLLLI